MKWDSTDRHVCLGCGVIFLYVQGMTLCGLYYNTAQHRGALGVFCVFLTIVAIGCFIGAAAPPSSPDDQQKK